MMNDDPRMCTRLDAWLTGDASPAERRKFAAHLDHCESCRDAVDQQRWIDELLRSSEAAAIEAAPTPATIPLCRRIRRRRQLLTAAAASIAVALAAPLIPLPRRDGSNRARSPVATEPRAVAEAHSDNDAREAAADPSPSPSLQGRGIADKPVATFASNGNAIAVPLASDDAEVTVVQLVPTVTAQVRRVHLTSAQPINNHGG